MADKDLVSVQQARDFVEAAHRAQAALARFDQGKIDRICEAMAKAALRPAPAVGCVSRASGHNIMWRRDGCQTLPGQRDARLLNFAARGATVAPLLLLSTPV